MAEKYKEDNDGNISASNNSVAVGSISAGGDISGNIHIGNVGYTPDEVSKLLSQISSIVSGEAVRRDVSLQGVGLLRRRGC